MFVQGLLDETLYERDTSYLTGVTPIKDNTYK
jgi:hypothetical protein